MTGKLGFFRVMLALGVSFISSAHPPTISKGVARKLVREAVLALGESRASIQIGPWDYHLAPEFYTFSAWRHNLADGLLVTYYFAVNPWTGDVWDAMGCKRITSPAMEKAQESISKRSRLPAKGWEALRQKSPACSEEEKRVDPRSRR